MENEFQNRIAKIEKEIKLLKSFTTIPFEVGVAFKERLGVNAINAEIDRIPDSLQNAPLAEITAPSGGLIVDSQARTAINTIITRLEDLGLVSEN